MLQLERIWQVYNSNSKFCRKKIYFGANGQFGPNLGQNYANLYLFEKSQDDGAYHVDVSYGSQFFQKKTLLEEMSNLDTNLPRILQPSVL